MESYGNLDRALTGVSDATTPPTWTALGRALRAWALRTPHEFQPIYGTPIPGYVAPPDTIPAAAAVAGHFLTVGARSAPAPFDTPELAGQFSPLASGLPHAQPAGAAAVLTELAGLVGFVGLELAGHFVGTADPADALYDALLRRQCATLGVDES
ncbi:MAG: TetR-like C-terminal domain-containing protein [Micropruina sp.]